MEFNIKKVSLFFLFLFPVMLSQLPGQTSSCSGPANWTHVQIDTAINKPSSEGILIVSSREYQPTAENGVFLTRNLSPDREPRYFIATCKDTLWKIHRVNSLTKGLDAINDGRNMVLFVHGNGKTLPLALERAGKIQSRYNVNVILFDWPSENFDLNVSINNLQETTHIFQSTLLALKSYRKQKMSPRQHLTIFMHSLGNMYMKTIAESATYSDNPEIFIDNIVFNAAAFVEKDHQETLKKLNIQKRLIVVYNTQDFILFGAQFFIQKAMLGNGTTKPFAGAYYIDFTEVAGYEHTYFTGVHDFENENDVVRDFYFNILNGRPVYKRKLTKINSKIYQVPH